MTWRTRRRMILGLVAMWAAAPAAAQPGAECAPLQVGARVNIDPARPGTEERPDVAVLPDGSSIVVYSAEGSPGSDDDRLAILMRRLGPNGAPAGPAVQLNTWTEEDQFVPRIAAAPDGRFVVAWQSDTSPDDAEFSSIRARVFDAAGVPVGPDFRVNVSSDGDQVDPDVAMADNGDFAVVWYDDADRPGSSQIGRGRDSRVRLFDAAGGARSGEIRINARTNGTQSEPAVAMSSGGAFAAAWRDNADGSVRARRFGAGGQPLDAEEFRIDTLGGNSNSEPDLAFDADGSFLVVWQSRHSPGNDQSFASVQARGFLASGTPASVQRQVNVITADDQFEPRVAAVGGREFMVAWDSQAPHANPDLDAPVTARGMTLEGQFLGGEVIAIPDAVMPAVGGNRAGRSVVVGRSGEIFAQLYDHPCATGGSGPTTCVEGPTTLCLVQDRFRVQVSWATPQGSAGSGQAIELTPDTGYFWFFNQENVEMVIKVLNACQINQRFWVFAAGLTNVEVEIAVLDTQTGVERPYGNPQGVPFQPIQDTSAFATCP
jgi:hypothetical protein